MLNPDRILVLCPHADDGEISCGGSIARFLEQDSSVFFHIFSYIEERKEETARAMAILERDPKNGHVDYMISNYSQRYLSESRQRILDEMISVGKSFSPTLVFLPSTYDTHQDHKVIVEEGIRAFKRVTVLGYEVLWNNMDFEYNMFINLEERHVEIKERLVMQYTSQNHRQYVDREFIRSLARIRGIQIDSKYAEMFEVIRMIV